MQNDRSFSCTCKEIVTLYEVAGKVLVMPRNFTLPGEWSPGHLVSGRLVVESSEFKWKSTSKSSTQVHIHKMQITARLLVRWNCGKCLIFKNVVQLQLTTKALQASKQQTSNSNFYCICILLTPFSASTTTLITFLKNYVMQVKVKSSKSKS